MFDVIGIVALGDDSPRPPQVAGAFPGPLWQGQRVIRNVVETQGMHVLCLSRPAEVQDYACLQDRHLFLVGEAFARLDSAGTRPGWTGRLSAPALLEVYLERGDQLLAHIKGNFTIVIVDEAKRQCLLCNSHFGISPFYYAWDGHQLLFSSSLVTLARCFARTPELDLAAVMEQAVFNYPLGRRTYFRDVRMLLPAEMVHADGEGLHCETYWDVRGLYDQPQLPHETALEMGADLFRQVVNEITADVPRLCLAFTSGFDSRAIMAVMEKDPEQYLAFSFGIPGSLNVEIPIKIAQELGISYRPFLLDSAYEQVFNENGLRAVILSEGLSTVERANYSYVFEQLSSFSQVAVTGLFGSELLRTFQNVDAITSANSVRVSLAADPRAELRRILLQPDVAVYLAPRIADEVVGEVEADMSAVVAQRFGDMPPDRRFYMFLLTEGLRKYFGAEVHIERPWVTNRFPYLDDEFVEFAFRAPFAGVYSRTITPTVANRFHSQYFYAYVINKYRPELLKARTDHGHSPKDLLSPFALLRIGPKYLLWRWIRRWTNYREFKTEEWTEALYRQLLFVQPPRNELFSQRLEDDFLTGVWKTHRREFARAASLKLWLETLE